VARNLLQRPPVGAALDVHPLGLYYNTKLFEQAGIVDKSGRAKPPRTLQEFLAAARKITKDTNKDGRPDQWGFVITNQRTNWLTITGQFGGGILAPDLKTCVMDSAANRKSLQLMHDFIYKYKQVQNRAASRRR
jgi:multiple sugar transport system substrate-binding protein